jgi:hypothetical protein
MERFPVTRRSGERFASGFAPMKRSLIATSWMVATGVPLLVSVVFLFGCCVLPFHDVAHKLMPICDVATSLLRGDYGDHHDEAQQSSPAREKEQPVKRLLSETPSSYRLTVSSTPVRMAAANAATSYRSFISLGATRCDQDVGLYVFVETFLI